MSTQKFTLIRKQKFEGGEGEGGEGGAPDDKNKKTEGGEGDGGDKNHKPSDREAELLKEVMKRKGNEQTLKDEVKELKSQLTKFDGIDVEQVRQLLQEKTDRETQELERRGEFDRVKEQMKEAHSTEMKTIRTSLEGERDALKAQLEAATSQINELTIGRAFSDSSFVRENLTLTPAKARVVFGSHFELQDGNVVAYDKPAGTAGRTVLVNGSGEPLSFDLAIEKIVKADSDADYLIRSHMKQGANSKSDKGTKTKPEVGSGRDRIAAAVNAGALKLTP